MQRFGWWSALIFVLFVLTPIEPLVALAALITLGSAWGVAKAAQRAAQRQEAARLVRDADEQHRWMSMGRPQGMYGHYPPAIFW